MHEEYHIVGRGSNRTRSTGPAPPDRLLGDPRGSFLDHRSRPFYNGVVIQIYGRRKCTGTRKAERFFSDRGIRVQSLDVDVKAPGSRELELFASVIGPDALLDTEGRAYRDRGLAYMEFDAVTEIAGDVRLLRTPIVRDGREVAVGEDPAFWARLAGQAKT